MPWIFAAIAAPGIWALTNIFDQDLVTRRSKDPLFLVGITGFFAGIPALIAIATGRLVLLSFPDLTLAITVGGIGLFAYVPYYLALKYDDAADVILFWNLTPVFVAILAFFIAHERLSVLQTVAVGVIVLSSFVAESAPNRKGSSRYAYALMLGASVLVALEVSLGKLLYDRVDFVSGFSWVSLTMFSCALVLLGVRRRTSSRKNSWKDLVMYVLSELCDTGATSLKAFAVSFGSASIVQALEGIQSLFVMGLESVGFAGKRPRRTPQQKIRIVVASLLAVIGLLLIV